MSKPTDTVNGLLYNEHGLPYVIALDFDGTLCSNAYPYIGEPNYPLIQRVIELHNKGVTFVLHTCREGRHLKNAIQWCLDMNIPIAAVNHSLPEWIERYGESRKVGADVYVDDKAQKDLQGVDAALIRQNFNDTMQTTTHTKETNDTKEMILN